MDMAKGQMRSTKEKKKPKQDKPKKAGPSYTTQSQTTEVFRRAENKGQPAPKK
jgi:hypothetical protein